MANLVDDKVQTGSFKDVEAGDTIDLAYRIEVHEPPTWESRGTVRASKAMKIQKFAQG